MLHLFRRLRGRATRKPVRRDTRTLLTIERLEERCLPSLAVVFSIPDPPGYRVYDNGTPATLTVQLVDTIGRPVPLPHQQVTVGYSTSHGSAQPGQDYQETAGQLTFGSNDTSKTFQVPIYNRRAPDRAFVSLPEMFAALAA